MLELLVLASVLQFEGGCCLLRNAPHQGRISLMDPHGSSWILMDCWKWHLFLGTYPVWCLNIEQCTGMYLNPAKKLGLLRISVILVPSGSFINCVLEAFAWVVLLQHFANARGRKMFQTPDHVWSCISFIGDMSRTWCPGDYWTNILVIDVHASLALGMHVKFLYTQIHVYLSIYIYIYMYV